jgi:Lhr-like helicase
VSGFSSTASITELYDLSKRLNDRFGVFTYDGDTPSDARMAIRERGHIVLTNRDMLHTGILPHQTKWMRLFENLNYIVLDELHTYRGVFGSHLANVLRRLRRVAQFYGSNPRFICCSATIANPGELQTSTWEDRQNGEKKYRTEIVARDIVLLGSRHNGEKNGGEMPGQVVAEGFARCRRRHHDHVHPVVHSLGCGGLV